ncbi:MAG: trigger factor [Mariprofundaceae bacterium]
MIQTEVTSKNANEHHIAVSLPQQVYDEIYARKAADLANNAKIPGFRAGKLPPQVVQKKFGTQLHDETASELVQAHYVAAIEHSGLTPALQPVLNIPAVQPASGFSFTLDLVTLPEIALKPLSEIEVERMVVDITDRDLDSVVERLMRDRVKYTADSDRIAEHGDRILIDFKGSVDGEVFEGGQAESVHLVLGEKRFLPDMEKGLEGVKAAESRTLSVSFPEDYGHAALAGKVASFDVLVHEVAQPSPYDDEADLAIGLELVDPEGLREDIRERLESESKQAETQKNQQYIADALLASHPLTLPNAMVQQEMQESGKRVVEQMKEQGVEMTQEMFADPAFQDELRSRAQRNITVSLLLQDVKESAAIEIEDADVDAELSEISASYPEEQREQFTSIIRNQEETMNSLRSRILERKCIAHIFSQAKVKENHVDFTTLEEQAEEQAEEHGESA